jgi:MFS family permease
MFAGGFFPFYGVILIALFLAGLGKSIFDPALQAYVGARVPFHRRGLVIGFLEFSWAGSTLLGIPAIALLIDRLGWRSPFFVMGGLGLLGILILRILIEKADKKIRRKIPCCCSKMHGALSCGKEQLWERFSTHFWSAQPMTTYLSSMVPGWNTDLV